MIDSTCGRVGLAGALLLCGALAGCGDNGNSVGFAADGGPAFGNAAVVTTGGGGSGPGPMATGGGPAETSGAEVSNAVTTASGGSGGEAFGNAASVTTASGGSGGEAFGNAASVTTASGGSGSGGGSAETSGGDSVGTTGAGGAPAETAPCGPEELNLNCEPDEICRGVEISGPARYSCEPNPCFEHDQPNSCECAASLCGFEAPNCVMLEEDTVVACICVFC